MAVNPQNRSSKKRWLLLLPTILLVAGGFWAYRIAKTLAGSRPVSDLLSELRDPRSQFPGKDRIVILIAGKDYNHTDQDIAYTTGSRSDTIMLVSADLATHQLSAVGVPRDTRVTAPDGVTGKINGTFQRGGIKLLAKTIEQEYGVHADYGVVLKPDAVKEIVDSLGGVEVEAKDRMFYEDSWDDLKIDLPAGRFRVNGEQAVGFVRFRKSGTHRYDEHKNKISVPYRPSKEEGDLSRIDRQQQLIRAMLAEVARPGNLVHLDRILDVAFDQVDTNLTRLQMLALAQTFRGGTGAGLGGLSIPGKDGNVGGMYYWLADKERASLTLKWVLFGDEAAGKQLTRVLVTSNAREFNEAKQLAEKLDDLGYSASASLTRRDMPTKTEVVYHSASFEEMGRQIAAIAGNAPLTKEPTDPRNYWIPEVKINMGKTTKGLLTARP
jgi:LCP family protein required for cell wall assembly